MFVNKVVRIFEERGVSNKRMCKLHEEAFHSLYPLPNIMREIDELCEHGNEFLGSIQARISCTTVQPLTSQEDPAAWT
jgi:hypothetical protein